MVLAISYLLAVGIATCQTHSTKIVVARNLYVNNIRLKKVKDHNHMHTSERMTMKILSDSDISLQCSLLSLMGLKVFLIFVAAVAVSNSPSLFFSIHGWSHRLAGALHLGWLLVGAWTALGEHGPQFYFAYDVILGVLGIFATLTAARDFPHKRISNPSGQSGTLHSKAVVTQSEMMEHSFYQGLNLWQAIYLHAMHRIQLQLVPMRAAEASNSWYFRIGLLWLVTTPWFFRKFWPVHNFSNNWKVFQRDTKFGEEDDSVEILLYRIKKAQYLFYKHVILHGVNITMVTNSHSGIPYSKPWRIFWILLNTSYVMEFFLQSLVKRRFLSQSTMLWLQRWLMMASSGGAMVVVKDQNIVACFLSLALNFLHRHHDLINTMTIASLLLTYKLAWNAIGTSFVF